MRRFLSWTLLACLLLASEARIDNAFGTEIEKHGHQKKEAQHLDPNPEQAIEGGKVRSVDHHNIVDYGGQSRRTTKESQSESDRNVKQQNSHNNEGQRRKWSLSKYASEGKAAGKWKAWKNQSKGKHKQDAGKCSQMKCTRKQVCLVNGETGVAECIPKRILRQSRKTDKSAKGRINRKQNSKKKHPSAVKLTNSKKGSADKHKKAHRIAKKIKNKAEKFQNKYQEKKRHHLHHLKDVSNQKRAPLHSASSINSLPLKPADTTTLKYCSQKELDVMGKRLLDWFKVLQDQSQQPHIIQKRNSKKKELHEQDECICQAPVRSEFLRLDKDQDDKLSVKELEELKTDSYEHCMKPFIKSCDHNRDGFLSDREWCCCFADVLPPCLAELKTVPAAMTMGAPAIIPGAFVPQCDSDGFYKPVQCHGSTGYCWCVDRNGVTLEGTHTRGMPKCEAAVKEETAYDKELPQLK